MQLLRDWRAGELRLLVFAVTLAVGALTAVAFFVDRLDRGLTRDAAQLLGGDGVVVADQRVPEIFEKEAARRGLQTVRMANFVSMARAPDEAGGNSRLVAVKAVTAAYPLRGELQVSDGNGAAEGPVQNVKDRPEPGTVWVEGGVLDALQLKVGDSLLLGDSTMRIARRLLIEPDRGAGFMVFAPRVLMNDADLAASGLVQPASRVTWRLAVAAQRPDSAADQAAVRNYLESAEQEIHKRKLRGVRVESLGNGRPEMRQTLDRAENFLKLVALLAALLAAIAVGIASRDYAMRRLDACALLRVLGEPQRRIAGGFAVSFLAAGTVASVAGVSIGLVLHQVFVILVGSLVGASLPAPGWWPAAFGLAVGWVLCAGFGLPPVLQLARVPALRVMRRDLGEPRAASLGVSLGGLVGFALLLWAVAADPKLGAYAIAGFAAAGLVFAAAGWLLLAGLRRLLQSPVVAAWPAWWRLATRSATARPGLAVLQISSLGMGLFALLLLVLLRTDLIASWRQATPPDAPNRFVINVQPDQAQPFRDKLEAGGVRRYDWYPMIRGRLVAVNGKAVDSRSYDNERARNLIDREFNLSHDARAPGHNPIVQGEWKADAKDEISVEEGLMKTLGLAFGDRLRFDVAGQLVEARITSVRKVDWSSMRVNFFVMFPRAQMPEMPVTYIAAFRAPERATGKLTLDSELSRAFPNITLVDTTASLAQVQRVLDQVIRAVEFLFLFTLAAGSAVLLAALMASRTQRVREFAVLRALGAGDRMLSRVQGAELLGLGMLAGALAASAAVGLGWVMASQVFEFDWTPKWWWPPLGAALGGVIAWAAGWWGLRGVLRSTVNETLREAAV
ncbi:MAG: FtsX-like permease family protein [Aquabacterium sp.]|nr:MAG: FtsX-like permease family protein [Aquabacterium sp.]